MNLLFFLIGCCTTWKAVESANILAVVPFNGRSHYIVIEPLLKGLAERGHQLTVVSAFPQKKPVTNLTDIDVSQLTPTVVNGFTRDLIKEKWNTPAKCRQSIWDIGIELCENFFADKKLQNLLLNTRDKYDLVITEIFSTDCFAAFAHKFDVPLVSITTTVASPWTNDRIGNPDNPSYIPNYLLDYGDRMTFYERLINTVSLVSTKILYYYKCDIPSHKIAKKYFGEDLPPLDQIVRERTSLILNNGYFIVNQLKPLVPNAIEIGGIHLQQSEPLPEETKNLLDNANNGIIFFSLGSVFKSSSMPKHIINAFLKAFSKLPQLVIWKFDEDIKNTPPNVLVRKWWPQKDILVHKNIKVFITHGGLSSTLEAVNAGVPVLGFPQFCDQPGNIASLSRKGAGIGLTYDDITYEKIHDAITKLINDKSYMESAKKLSRQFKDRPISPLENAIFWVEYVLRHKGAYHMHSAATNLPLYQLLLLDVIAFLSIASFIFLLVIYKILKISYIYIFETKLTKKVKINQTKKKQ